MAQQALTVAGLTVQPGERRFGYLHVGYLAAGTEVRVPLHVVHGAEPGPTLGLVATLHGWEPVGAEIVRRALQRVDPLHLRGTVLCLPFAHPLSVEFGGTVESSGMRVSPGDSLDLNRVWPGRLEHAWLTEQTAAVQWREVISRCQYVLDLHDGTGACDEMPVAFPYRFPIRERVVAAQADGVGGGEGLPRRIPAEHVAEMNRRILELGLAFGSRVVRIRDTPLNPGMLSGSCVLHGIVPLVVEAGGGSALDDTIDEAVECTLNILRFLDMIDGSPVRPRSQVVVDRYVVYRSRTGGYYLPEPGIALGVTVEKGQLLGRVVDPVTSEIREECRSPVRGIVVSRRILLPIHPGGYIAHLADLDATVEAPPTGDPEE